MKSQSKKTKKRGLSHRFMAIPLLASTILSGIPASKAEAGILDAVGAIGSSAMSGMSSVASAVMPQAVTDLMTNGVPAWVAESRLYRGASWAGKTAASMAVSHVATKGTMFALATWAPGILAPTLLGVPVAAVAVPLIVGLVASGGIKRIVAFGKENPKTAVALGTAAILGAYFGGHYIKSALEQMGNTSLAIKKAVIDHGSGSVKMSIATMNPFTGAVIGDTVDVSGMKLAKVAVEMSKTMQTTVDGVKLLAPDTMTKGIDTVKAMVEFATSEGVSPHHITAVATEWARTGAANIPAYIEQMREATGVSLIVAEQIDEAQLGVMAIDAALRNGPSSAGLSIGDRVLDAGGGSAQFSAITSTDVSAAGAFNAAGTAKASGDMGKYASEVAEKMRSGEFTAAQWTPKIFKHLTETAQSWTQGEHSMKTVPFEGIRTAMQAAGHSTYALGNVYGSAKELSGEALEQCLTTLSAADLDHAMAILGTKTAEEVTTMVVAAGMPAAIAPSVVTNIPLVRGMMGALGVAEVEVLKANSGMAAFTLPKFWQTAASAYSNVTSRIAEATAGLASAAMQRGERG